MTDINSRADSGPPSADEHAVTVPLTGQQYQIGAGRYRATVTELGAGVRELLSGDQPVIAGYRPDELPPAAAGQLWPPGRTGSTAAGTPSAAPSRAPSARPGSITR